MRIMGGGSISAPPALPVGLFSLLGSIGWAWAFTLESAAKVRTLGQVELTVAPGGGAADQRRKEED